jgi:hypothetical protein
MDDKLYRYVYLCNVDKLFASDTYSVEVMFFNGKVAEAVDSLVKED